jgi:uncharacterized protein YbaR (Trm112 family)
MPRAAMHPHAMHRHVTRRPAILPRVIPLLVTHLRAMRRHKFELNPIGGGGDLRGTPLFICRQRKARGRPSAVMKYLLTDLLICPACRPDENRLTCDIHERDGDDILTGLLNCKTCGARYAIEEGIASLLPPAYPNDRRASSKYERPEVVGAYLWSHYADLFGDPDASDAYRVWSGLLRFHSGYSLDAGCAVGRFTFEMGAKGGLALGMDTSRAFIRQARALMRHRKLTFQMPEEGVLTRSVTIEIPQTWGCETVEFVLGDVQSLPFPSGLFSSLASLNVVDKVPRPFVHLKEMNRVAKERRAQLLFSDPFSWSTGVAREEEWLGGTPKGAHSRSGMETVVSLLTGEREGLSPPWAIETQGRVWWKIRNHRNHFELIRSCYLKACR